MNILVADDLETNRKLLTAILTEEGYQIREARDGGETLAALAAATEPLVALIDWQMPVATGVEVCREARKAPNANLLFMILVTVRDRPADVVEGLQAGANDYVTKPFDAAELVARVRIGHQMLELQRALAARVHELEAALAHIKQLKGLLPICSYCKKIRDDKDYWQQVEVYVTAHSDARFSHGICPECFDSKLRPELVQMGMSDADLEQIKNPKTPRPP